jgi:hypothetical protein
MRSHRITEGYGVLKDYAGRRGTAAGHGFLEGDGAAGRISMKNNPRKMRLACLEFEEMIHLYGYDRFRSAMRRPCGR